MSIGVIIRKKIVLFKNTIYALLHTAANSWDRWMDGGCEAASRPTAWLAAYL